MSVAVSDVRFAIQDQPRNVGVLPESPRALGTADGVTTVFFLPLERFQVYYADSPAALFGTISGVTTGIASSAYSISTSGQVTFVTPPADGTFLSASYQVTNFADADLQNVLTRNTNQYGGSIEADGNTLRGCQIEIINLILSNPDRLSALTEAQYKNDRNAATQALQRQLAELRTQINTPPIPDSSKPILTIAGPVIRSYQPGR
jgi:hypothetical protein